MTARDRALLGVLAVAGLLAAFWFVLLAPKRADSQALDAKIVQAEQRRDAAAASAGAAVSAKARYREDYATVARLGKAVPADDDVASLVYQLESIASRHSVDFRSVQVKDAPADAPAAATPAPTGPDAEAKAPGEAATPPAAEQPTTPAAGSPGASVGSAGLRTLPFSFVFEGTFLKLQRFLRSIDGLTQPVGKRVSVRGRLLTVNGFSLGAARGGLPRIKAQVEATAYVLPAGEDALGGATPQGPPSAAGGTPTAGATAPNTTAAVGGTG